MVNPGDVFNSNSSTVMATPTLIVETVSPSTEKDTDADPISMKWWSLTKVCGMIQQATDEERKNIG